MGKVHGSLARAGKVKSQTPKVCKISTLGTRNRRRMSGIENGGTAWPDGGGKTGN